MVERSDRFTVLTANSPINKLTNTVILNLFQSKCSTKLFYNTYLS